MTKTIFVFTVIVIFVAIAVWFFMQKTKESEKNVNPAESTPTPLTDAGGPIKYDNGLITEDLLTGTGKAAANGDTLSANYIGTLEDGTKFDSSYDRGQPLEFVLGSGQLIQGWELGLIGMKEGGKRKLVIPPTLGYGAKGAGGVIPPNATLVFEIELVGIIKK